MAFFDHDISIQSRLKNATFIWKYDWLAARVGIT